MITEDAPTIRVQAGPGTGKTFGLRKRVLRLLHPSGLGADAGRVLVCSFNRVIAEDLKREIAQELAPHELPLPRVSTVHSLCASMLGGTPRLLLPHEQEPMMYDVRRKHPALSAQYEHKQAKALRALRSHEAGLEDHPGLVNAVNEWLADHGASLIGDVTREVDQRLTNGDFDTGQYDHVIVDEFQDLTESEASILVQLCAEDGTLVVLGDRKQSIYAFRGNDERGLDALPDLVSDPIADRPMDECQRCPEEVVFVANAMMELEGDPLVPVRGPGGQIHQVHHDSPADEASAMAKEIIRVAQAAPEDTHLVLVTRRRWGYDLRNAIREAEPGFEVQTAFSEDVLETWGAREAFVLLEIHAAPDPVAIRDWIGYQEPEAGKKFKAPDRNAAVYSALRAEFGPLTKDRAVELAARPVNELTGSGRKKVKQRLERLKSLLIELEAIEDAQHVVDWIFDPDRWVDYEGAHADLAGEDIRRLHAEATKLLGEGLDLGEIAPRLRYRIATREPLGTEQEARVRIVTLWGAKGLTADYVYLVGLVDEALPGPHDPDSTGLTAGEHEAEQRRLLYVSLTRAKKSLVLSRPKRISRGDALALGLAVPTFGWTVSLHRTRFLAPLPAGLLPVSVAYSAWEGVAA